MKRCLLFLLLLLSLSCYSNPLIHFKVSRPLCVLTFLQAASGNGAMLSPTLKSYISKNIPTDDSVKFNAVLRRFAALNLDLTYTVPDYPESRLRPRSTLDLITIAAIQAADPNDFMQRIIGILPNEQWLELNGIMKEAGIYYEQMLGIPYAKAMRKQLFELEKYNEKLDDVFNRLKRFYGTTWSEEIPFTIGVYAIPGKKGNTTATPHSNSLVLAVLTEEKDYAMRVSVALHEVCHVFYAEQPLALQRQLDNFFQGNTLPGAQFAYNYIDEALATACGNAWVYHELTGHDDTGSWYNDAYIDGYAHAIYPMVKGYLNEGRQMDSAFIARAIDKFHDKFPAAHLNYQNLLNKVNLYTDAKDQQEFSMINATVNSYFRVTSSYGSYPITDPQTESAIDGAKGTQFFIVHTQHEKNFKLLKQKFPQLKTASYRKDGIFSFINSTGAAIIVLNIKDITELEKGIRALAKNKAIDPASMFTTIE